MLDELRDTERLTAMAQRGQIPTLWSEETYRREEAESVGAKLTRFSLRPLLYGTDGIDVRARLWADRLLERNNPNATTVDHLEWTDWFGAGIPEVMGAIPRRIFRVTTFLLGVDYRAAVFLTSILLALRLIGAVGYSWWWASVPVLVPLLVLVLRLLRYGVVMLVMLVYSVRHRAVRAG